VNDPQTIQEWIAHVDRLREDDWLLSRGAWHGYLNDVPHGGGVLRGYYVLARWRPAPGGSGGSVVVAHDDSRRVVKLAHRVEEALYNLNSATTLGSYEAIMDS